MPRCDAYQRLRWKQRINTWELWSSYVRTEGRFLSPVSQGLLAWLPLSPILRYILTAWKRVRQCPNMEPFSSIQGDEYPFKKPSCCRNFSVDSAGFNGTFPTPLLDTSLFDLLLKTYSNASSDGIATSKSGSLAVTLVGDSLVHALYQFFRLSLFFRFFSRNWWMLIAVHYRLLVLAWMNALLQQ
jgi:hypothetical protein